MCISIFLHYCYSLLPWYKRDRQVIYCERVQWQRARTVISPFPCTLGDQASDALPYSNPDTKYEVPRVALMRLTQSLCLKEVLHEPLSMAQASSAKNFNIHVRYVSQIGK
jgi:hypothetical protein